ncbi:MAG: monofunctional biosynthetic peptidoglycan transglycosylase [Acidobacteria bacterium]|nr:monofunctional biosynthetic peptidoglycan transglycosylase [Acidobacteriota bacterium]
MPSKKVNASTKVRKQENARSWSFKRIFLILFLAVFGYIGLEFLFLPTGKELKAGNPTSTAMIEARKKEAVSQARTLEIKQNWQPINQISKNLVKAVLAGEDSRFFQHNGFDTEELKKAVEKDWEEGRFVRGASTISQQLAKNLYLSESKNPIRKVKEAAITYYLEKNLGKKRILEIYLNVIEWGDGVFGAEAASRKYFNKSVSELSSSEAAYLAAMIPNPRTVYNPTKNPKKVARRQNIIAKRMNVVRLPKGW